MQDDVLTSFRLSPQQEELWTAEPDGPTARVQGVLAVDGLAADALRGALDAAVARHEILRTTFRRQAGVRVPFQVVRDELAPGFEARRADALETVLGDELARPLDFEAGPLLRAVLVTLPDGAERLVLTASALVCDAGSLRSLTVELAKALGAGLDVPESPLQYADFAEWQHELASADDEDAAYGRDLWSRAGGASSPGLPFLSAGPAAASAEVEVAVDGELAGAIGAAAGRYGTTPSVLALAAWHALLARLSGEAEVAVATLLDERGHEELDGAIGLFSRPLPLRTASGGRTFAELMDQVARAVSDAADWQDYLPAGAAADLAVGAVVTADLPDVAVGGGRLAVERIASTGARFAVALACEAGGDGRLRLALLHDPARLPAPRAEELAARFDRVLRAAAAAPETPVAELEVLGEEERALLTQGPAANAAPIPEGTLAELFAAQAAASAAADAVVDDAGAISYADLDRRANQLANRLRRAGVAAGDVVGLATDRSVDMVVGLLGILKAGAGYLPLHYEHPKARLAHQLAETGARALVTQSDVLERLPEFAGEVVCLDRDRGALDGESADPAAAGGSPDDLAYVIYTSGSTGTPKGVAVTQRNVANYVGDMTRRLRADRERLAFGMVTAVSTDLGNTALFPALLSGGTLVLASPAVAADAAALAERFAATPVDVLKITPSHLGALLIAADARVLPRRLLVVGGERLGWDLVERVRSLGGPQILNHYGPTETTIGSCTNLVPDGPGPDAPATVPIGTPIANTACYVLDDLRRPVPTGVRGRLFIGGAGVARGYVGQPGLTAERFLADPFAGGGARMYDTGDLARRLGDGALEFLGRADEQVKIRGYRVEPAEVESALRGHPGVRDAVVLAREDVQGDARLVAYVVAGADVRHEDLRSRLGEWLPEFMIPSAYVSLDALPLTPSGKVDRLALPEPEAAGRAGAFVAPRTPMEEAVAAIWSQVLGIPEISVEDDFFALGGHSLLATQVVAQIRSDFAVDLPLHSVFTSPTVASLAEAVVSLLRESEDEETARLVAELEGLSDEEAERLLADEAAREQG